MVLNVLDYEQKIHPGGNSVRGFFFLFDTKWSSVVGADIQMSAHPLGKSLLGCEEMHKCIA